MGVKIDPGILHFRSWKRIVAMATKPSYTTLFPEAYKKLFPWTLETRTHAAIAEFCPVTACTCDQHRQIVETELRTGDLLLSFSRRAEDFELYPGFVCLATGSRIMHVGVVIEHNDSLEVFGITDMIERFSGDKVDPIQLVTPLEDWINQVQASIFVRPLHASSEQQTLLASLASTFVPVAPLEVPVFYSAVVVAKLLQQAGLLPPGDYDHVVPAHFHSDLPTPTSEVFRLHEFVAEESDEEEVFVPNPFRFEMGNTSEPASEDLKQVPESMRLTAEEIQQIFRNIRRP